MGKHWAKIQYQAGSAAFCLPPPARVYQMYELLENVWVSILFRWRLVFVLLCYCCFLLLFPLYLQRFSLIFPKKRIIQNRTHSPFQIWKIWSCVDWMKDGQWLVLWWYPLVKIFRSFAIRNPCQSKKNNKASILHQKLFHQYFPQSMPKGKRQKRLLLRCYGFLSINNFQTTSEGGSLLKIK